MLHLIWVLLFKIEHCMLSIQTIQITNVKFFNFLGCLVCLIFIIFAVLKQLHFCLNIQLVKALSWLILAKFNHKNFQKTTFLERSLVPYKSLYFSGKLDPKNNFQINCQQKYLIYLPIPGQQSCKNAHFMSRKNWNYLCHGRFSFRVEDLVYSH